MAKIGTIAYTKMVLHALKYPQYTVRGILLGKKVGDDLRVLDAIPALHGGLLAPPLEILLIHLDSFCSESQLQIVGIYFCNERRDDNSFDDQFAKVAEKLQSNTSFSPIVLQIDNSKLSLNADSSCLHGFTYENKSWKSKSCEVERSEETLATTSLAIQSKLYRELIDFEAHLDDPNLADFFNSELNSKIEQLL
uniref:MPN domain-containing protein n=1 Tax=Acrobeloides nanus TaxID=290746 RepID=A0A914DIY9_9BILA